MDGSGGPYVRKTVYTLTSFVDEVMEIERQLSAREEEA